MNNLLDYSHMIKTYVMKTNYDNYNDDYPNYPINLLMQFECKCDQFIFCYNSSNIKKCKHYNMIINNLPLFKIILNKNNKKEFNLPKEWSNSNLTTDEFFKVILYIISFADESIDYITNKPYIKSIISLSLYILIINNHNNIKSVFYLLEPLLNNLKNKLAFYLSDDNSVEKLNGLFKKYFLEKPDKNLQIMHKWIIMIDELILHE